MMTGPAVHEHTEECQPKPGDVLCIIPGPSHVYRSEDGGVRWCFKCRAHLPHVDELMGDPPDVLSYYDPVWVTRCSRCGECHTQFPTGW